MPAIDIEPIPAFTDNYIWCLHSGGEAWVVDPGDAAPVIDFIAKRKLDLRGILITHHHPDHIGGVGALREHFSLPTIYGPHNPAIAHITDALREGDTLVILGEKFAVLEVPGHTLDHIAYISQTLQPPALFCGDTLFAAGCGRLFEGTPAQMFASLNKFKQLAPETRVFCTHEYTQANLRFAKTVEPDNLALTQRAQDADSIRAKGQPTLPSTLALELATNPFLRTATPAVRNAALHHVVLQDAVSRHAVSRNANADLTADRQNVDEVDVFAAVRRWKDNF